MDQLATTMRGGSGAHEITWLKRASSGYIETSKGGTVRWQRLGDLSDGDFWCEPKSAHTARKPGAPGWTYSSIP